MEAICEIAILIAFGVLATQFGKLISYVADRYRALSIPALHFRFFILSAFATVPSLLVIHEMASFDWGGYFPLYQLIYLLGLPLILLGQPITELLENTFSISASSLDLWVQDSLLVLQWILWGQLLAAYIGAQRQEGPGHKLSIITQETLEGFLLLMAKAGHRIEKRYGQTAVMIAGFAIGFMILLSVCSLLVWIFCSHEHLAVVMMVTTWAALQANGLFIPNLVPCCLTTRWNGDSAREARDNPDVGFWKCV